MAKNVLFKIACHSVLVAVTIVQCMFAGSAAYAASIEYKGNCTIVISGEIDSATDAALKRLYESSAKKCSSPTLYLNSNGGDVDAAIRAGDFIRDNNFTTWVGRNASCASACVLLFVGGANRMVVGGKIGLHRPYFDKYSTSKSEARDSYEKINSRIRQYLNRMNIPEGLLSKMNAVSSGGIKWLVFDDENDFVQLQELHIIGKDPVFEDQKDSALAKRLGISKREYYSREQRANAICPDPVYDNNGNLYSPQERDERGKQYTQCYWDVMYGRR